MQRKAIVLFFLAAMLLAATTVWAGGGQQQQTTAAGFNRSGFPIVNEPVTLHVMGVDRPDRDWETNAWWQRMTELTNLRWRFNQVEPAGWQERKNLAFASGDLPDIFFKAALTSVEEMQYGSQGMFIPLQDLIDEYAPNIVEWFGRIPGAREAVTLPSGDIVAFPSLSEPDAQIHQLINRAWLDRLGLPMPTSHEEYYNTLVAFRDSDANGNGDPNDEIPMTMTGHGTIYWYMSWFGLRLRGGENLMTLDDRTDRMIFAPMDNGFREGLKFFARLYQEGLLDNDIFLQSGPQINAKGRANRLGAFATPGGFLQVGNEYHFDYEPIEPFEYDGRRVHFQVGGINRGAGAITSTNRYPEVSVRFFDYFYSEEGARLMWAGLEGQEYRWVGENRWNWILNPGQSQNDIRVPQTIQGAVQLPGRRPDDFWNQIDDAWEASLPEKRALSTRWARYQAPFFYFDQAVVNQLASIGADLEGYVQEFVAKAVVGEVDIDGEWNNYLATLRQMGVDRMVGIYQQEYERMQARR